MKKEKTGGFLGWVERVGNKIPHPFILFLWLIGFVMVLSWILERMGVQAVNPVDGEAVAIQSVLSVEGLYFFLDTAVKNFIGFAPLGLVLTMTLGIGLAEQTGMMSAFMRKTILGAPEKLVVFIIMLIGICGNVASDAAIVIIPTLAAVIFKSMGRHPIAGIALGYAATTAGFSANLIIAGTDALLMGITNEAADIVQAPHIQVTANWYFMIASTLVISVVGAFINNRIVEPRLGTYQTNDAVVRESLSVEEKKGLRNAGIALLVFLAIILAMTIPANGPLRNPETGAIATGSYLLKGIIPILLLLFVATSVAYGKTVGVIKSSADIPKMMTTSMKTMASFIVLAFVIGQFIAFFNWSNLGLVLAIEGANLLNRSGFTGVPLYVTFILLSTFVNMFIGSGSAKWALLAPIFVPMFFLLGEDPAVTQVLYRIGDSSTNIITPLFPYFPIILILMQEYDENAGVGTLLSNMIPYSLIILGVWTAFIMIWLSLGIPLGI